MTPLPLVLFVWGIAMSLRLLPHRLGGVPLPRTPMWERAPRALGMAAMLASGFWLLLDVTLPRVMPKQPAARLADAIGWGCLAVAAALAVVWIRWQPRWEPPREPDAADRRRVAEHRPTQPPGRDNI